MPFLLDPLPYAVDALEPHLGAETLRLHHGAHHRGYVDKLNELTRGKREESLSLEDLIRSADGKIFENAAQVWNHSFYWRCMRPSGGGEPEGMLLDVIENGFGSYEKLCRQLEQTSADVFGTGWTWLVRDKYGRLAVQGKQDADNPLRDGYTPILTIDLWEHAYYLDYRNKRDTYVKTFLEHLVDWRFVTANLRLTPESELRRQDREDEHEEEEENRYL
jgi:Fe-Mn family superoxide dismutase